MTNTTHYNLKKPGDADNVQISELNDNMDILDTQLYATDQVAKAALPKSGGKMTGALDMGGQRVSNLPAPSAAGDPARKQDLDDLDYADVGAAAASHTHSASDITSGTLSTARLPTVPVTSGGTGSTTASGARTNLGAAPLASPTFTGTPKGPSSATDYSTARFRNIRATTVDLTPGVSTLNSGEICLVYE